MLAEVVPARFEGLPLPRWQWGAKLRRGTLRVFEEHCPESSRTVRTARLTDQDGLDELLPLRDVQLLCIEGEVLTILGFEAVACIDRWRMYRQSWIVRCLSTAEFDASKQKRG